MLHTIYRLNKLQEVAQTPYFLQPIFHNDFTNLIFSQPTSTPKRFTDPQIDFNGIHYLAVGKQSKSSIKNTTENEIFC